MRVPPAALLSALLLTVFPAPLPAGQTAASEEEVIESFDITMQVEAGGSMLVTERISVRALGAQVKRGIFRDVPTTFPRRFNLGRIEAPFEVVSVTRDGTSENYRVEGIGDGIGRGGVRIRIGRGDEALDPGTYVYEIVYRTDRWVRYGDTEDQIYWNVTGNGWALPIERASATIRVEGLTATPTLESWTGPDGATSLGAHGSWDGSAGTAYFETTRPLTPGEGLTVRMTFPTGELQPPSDETRAEWFQMDFGGYIDTGYLILLVIAVYLLMWRRVGIDPARGPTTLRSEPPRGFSPAELGYIHARGYGKELLSAALVNLALKGAIRINRQGTSWSLDKLEDEPEGLAPEEQALFRQLLGSRKRISLKSSRYATLASAIKDFRSSLRRRLERVYFENNRNWFYGGLTVSVAGFVFLTMRWHLGINPVAGFLTVWLGIWTIGTGTLVIRVIRAVRDAQSSPSPIRYGGIGFLAMIALPFVLAEVVVLTYLAAMVPSHLILAAVALGAVNVLFYHLLERPTLKGRGVLNEVDGFRMWLAGEGGGPTSQNRSIAAFERHLPFAIALGLDTRWTEAFSDVLEPLMTTTESAAAFPWYDHRENDHRSFNARTFATSLSSSLASTLSSNSSPPSSSSGGSGGSFSSGGGSSGGGGGGGGGGGW